MSFSGEKTFINVLPSRNRISCLFFVVKYITHAKHECPLLEAPISLAEGEYHCEAVLALSPVVLRKGVNGGKREGERSERESVVPRQNKDSRRVGGHAPPQRHLKRSEATTKTRFTGRKQNKRKRILLSSRPPESGGSRGENARTSFLRSEGVVFPSYSKDIVFSRTCAGKRHLKSRERGDEREVHGEKTTERASCEVRLVSSRRFPKVGLTGRKRVKRSDYPLSSRPLTNLCYTAPRRR